MYIHSEVDLTTVITPLANMTTHFKCLDEYFMCSLCSFSPLPTSCWIDTVAGHERGLQALPVGIQYEDQAVVVVVVAVHCEVYF